MKKNEGLLNVAHIFFRLIVAWMVSVTRLFIHCIDDWATNDKHEVINDDETYIPPEIVEPHPYGYDLMGEPKQFQGELTTNDIAVIFDDI